LTFGYSHKQQPTSFNKYIYAAAAGNSIKRIFKANQTSSNKEASDEPISD